MTTRTTSLTDSYRRADAPLSRVTGSLSAADWEAASPCEGWTARDVVAHMIDAQRDFLTGHDVVLGDRPDVDADPARAWADHRDAVLAVVADDDVTGTAFDGHFGPTTVGETLDRFYVFDMIAHRWDIARAAGRDERFTVEELDRLETAIEGFGPAIHAEGICKPGVEAPEDADRQTRVLASLGRRP